MKKKHTLLILTLMFLNLVGNEYSKYQLNEIHKWADVLNIEGGNIPKKLCPNQKWFNVATILDRPYIDGVEFDYMAKNKKYDLKESAIMEYNELQNNFVHVTLLKYCIDNAHQISNKSNDETVKIIVQVHRPKSGVKYIKLLDEIINSSYPEFSLCNKLAGKLGNEVLIYELPNNVSLHYRFGSEPHTLIDYECADIVISISLVAGFNSNFKPGDMVMPTKFVPMDLDTMILRFNQKYFVKNYFFENLKEIIKSQDLKLLQTINDKFSSPNKEKFNLKAHKFLETDFNEVTVLHVNKNFSPSLLPKEFEMEN